MVDQNQRSMELNFTKMKREDLNSPLIKCLELLLHSEEGNKYPKERATDLTRMKLGLAKAKGIILLFDAQE